MPYTDSTGTTYPDNYPFGQDGDANHPDGYDGWPGDHPQNPDKPNGGNGGDGWTPPNTSTADAGDGGKGGSATNGNAGDGGGTSNGQGGDGGDSLDGKAGDGGDATIGKGGDGGNGVTPGSKGNALTGDDGNPGTQYSVRDCSYFEETYAAEVGSLSELYATVKNNSLLISELYKTLDSHLGEAKTKPAKPKVKKKLNPQRNN